MQVASILSPSHRHPWRQPRVLDRRHGFTLIEAMVTVLIGAILVALAAPAFTSLVASQRAKSAASELYVTLTKARSEAVRLNNQVSVVPVGGGWQAGWQVVDSNSNVLDTRSATTGATFTAPASVIYRPDGRILAVTAPMFVITVTSGSSSSTQCVSADLSGRPYMKSGSSC